MNARLSLLYCLFSSFVLFSQDISLDKTNDTQLHITPLSMVKEEDTLKESAKSSIHKSRKRGKKPSSKKNKKRKTISNMEVAEIKEALEKSKHNTEFSIKCIQQLIKITTDTQELAELLLQLADLYFQTGEFETAIRLFNEFLSLYPGNKNIEYALYKSIVALFNTTLDFDRDQTNTRACINKANAYLQQTEIFSQYTEEIEKIRTLCYTKLAHHELSIGSFYAHRGNIKAAQKRAAYVRTTLLQQIPDIEQDIIALEHQLPQSTDQAIQITPLIKHKEPELLIAANKTEKRSAASRF